MPDAKLPVCDLCGPAPDVQLVTIRIGTRHPQPDLSVSLCARHRQPLAELVGQVQRQILAGIAPAPGGSDA